MQQHATCSVQVKMPTLGSRDNPVDRIINFVGECDSEAVINRSIPAARFRGLFNRIGMKVKPRLAHSHPLG